MGDSKILIQWILAVNWTELRLLIKWSWLGICADSKSPLNSENKCTWGTELIIINNNNSCIHIVLHMNRKVLNLKECHIKIGVHLGNKPTRLLVCTLVYEEKLIVIVSNILAVVFSRFLQVTVMVGNLLGISNWTL